MKSSSKKPLEWQIGRVNTTDATVTNFRIELGLKDDEVAEIHKVDSNIFGRLTAGADDIVEYNMMLSMDPDIDASPAVAANHDDLEVFFEHFLHMDRDLTTTGQSQSLLSDHKVSDFKSPVLVGTDVGMVVIGDAAMIGAFWVRLYFTRRKASVTDLNQVLLKRR